MSRFSKSDAEAAGWSIVHKRDAYEVTVGPGLVKTTPATIVAEKYHSPPGQKAILLHEEAETMGLLLERIFAWEQHQANISEVEPVPVDTDTELKTFSLLGGEDADGVEVGQPVQNVVIPVEPGDLSFGAETATITDAEWSARSRADTLVVQGEAGEVKQVVYAGGSAEVLDAEAARLENKKAIEDRRAAEPAHGPTEQVEFDTAGLADTPGIGAGGTLVVREGLSLDEVAAVKDDLKKMREEGRVASMNAQGEAIAPEGADKLAGLDVGIQERGDLGSEMPGQGAVAGTLEEPSSELDENPAPHLYPEGSPAVSEPPEVPAHEAELEAASEAEEEQAKEDRDEVEQPQAEAPENVVEENDAEGPDAVVGEGEPETSDSDEADSFTEKDDIEATDAAKAKANELGVDLSEVEGTGKDGRITAPDVEAAAEQKDE